MKPINVIKMLNESVSLEQIKKLPDFVIEKILDGDDSVTYWHCNNCDSDFEETDTVNTNMEKYYGVASDFPDSHYANISVCPYCKDDDISEITIHDWDIEDAFLSDTKLHNEMLETFEKRRPEVVGAFYTKEGHHADFFEANPEIAWDMIKEFIEEGKY